MAYFLGILLILFIQTIISFHQMIIGILKLTYPLGQSINFCSKGLLLITSLFCSFFDSKLLLKELNVIVKGFYLSLVFYNKTISLLQLYL